MSAKFSALRIHEILAMVLFLLFSGPLTAAQRTSPSPDSPEAASKSDGAIAVEPPAVIGPPTHRFWDRTNILLFSGIAVTRGVDFASTRNFQDRGRQEILLPDAVVDNSAGFASLEAAGTMTSVGVSYILHRTGHHKLERWMSIGHITVAGFGDVRNYCLKTRRR